MPLPIKNRVPTVTARLLEAVAKLLGSLRAENSPDGSPVAELRDALQAWNQRAAAADEVVKPTYAVTDEQYVEIHRKMRDGVPIETSTVDAIFWDLIAARGEAELWRSVNQELVASWDVWKQEILDANYRAERRHKCFWCGWTTEVDQPVVIGEEPPAAVMHHYRTCEKSPLVKELAALGARRSADMGDDEETGFNPDWTIHPGATLVDLMEHHAIDADESARRCGLPRAVFDGVLDGSVQIDDDIAAALERGFAHSRASFWLAREKRFRGDLAAGRTWIH